MANPSKKVILGLDILPNRKSKTFAYCLLNERGEKIESGYISINELSHFIEEKSVDIIAIDNIFEIYPKQSDIIRFLRKNRVKLLQVTGFGKERQKLSFLAKKYKIFGGGKLSPEIAAEAVAKLAYMGIGFEINIFEDTTRIIISRTRSLGEGGQHQAKYARKIASLILQEKKRIEKLLKDNGFSYEVFVREGDKGLKGAKFIVYAPYDKVKRIVKNSRNEMIQVKVLPITKEKITFLATMGEGAIDRYLICGLDPGETTGLALIDLNGNVIYIDSKREWGLLDIINKIYEFGKPLIISTDVPKVPQSVERLAKKIGATIFSPNRTISLVEKYETLRQLNIKVRNAHERDALIAALMAYKKFKNIFDKIDSILSYIPLDINPDLVKKDVVMGSSIKEAIWKQIRLIIENISNLSRNNKRSISDLNNVIETLKNERTKLLKKLSESYKKIEELENEVYALKKELKTKEAEIEKLKEELFYLKNKLKNSIIKTQFEQNEDYIKKFRQTIKELNQIITSKNKQVEELKKEVKKFKILAQRKPYKIPIKVLRRFTSQEIDYLEEEMGLGPGDIVYIVDPAGGGRKTAKRLIEIGVRAVIIGEGELPSPAKEELEKANVPIIKYDKIKEFIEKIDVSDDIELEFISKKVFDKVINDKKIEEKSGDKEKDFDDEIISIIHEYRNKRKQHYFT